VNKQTLILLKPDALKRQLDQPIVDIFLSYGFSIIYQQQVKVNKDTILKHYEEVISRLKLAYLPQAILSEFENAQVKILILEHPLQDAISLGREVIGATDPAKALPHTIRGKFAQDTLATSILEKRMLRNLIHASDSIEAVQRECELWLGKPLQKLVGIKK
jgi:nucleoside-diphosphate kinase